ncbi:hypothetical protein GGTG_09300 [Gaeumannomyces tritici R3-111a-1]|uniref:Uncharacterized protein n=1 Tax=Gaeumannomyces tritici (strain R3-111a-1) TaxID=644352 RepID=J3P703_GAET3|nr:hypothetical protein GGTG_09300 [Gaeumannomyces tritici R3-111a-1]EJT72434.1 hypothetical protein GGTG_09300 [Gaeumannomyces tritici R3-111a-1]
MSPVPSPATGLLSRSFDAPAPSSNSGTAKPDLADIVGWVSETNDRGTADILWSSCVTIILCVWIATSPNVPGPEDKWHHRWFDKLNLACIGLVGPHFLLRLAVGQLLNAKQSVRILRQLPGGETWTLRHGFFANMGGFYIRAPDYPNGFPINGEQLAYLVKYRHLDFPTLTSEDINRRNRIDGLSKFITIWQVAWFIITQSQRLAKGYPITTLELTALSFCANTIATSACWYYKPAIEQAIFLDTRGSVTTAAIRESARAKSKTHPNLPAIDDGTPLDFLSPRPIYTKKFWHYLPMTQGLYTRLFNKQAKEDRWQRIPSNTWLEIRNLRWGLLMAVAMLPFSVTFFGAWNFHFPTTAERSIWRLCATYHVMFNLVGCLSYIRNYVAEVLVWVRMLLRRLVGMKPVDNEQSCGMRAKGDEESSQGIHPLPPGNGAPEQRSLEYGPARPTANGTSHGRLARDSRTASGGSSHINSHQNMRPRKGAEDATLLRFRVALWFFCFVYLVCRLYIYIESLAGLRSQRRGVYMTVNKFLPSIS